MGIKKQEQTVAKKSVSKVLLKYNKNEPKRHGLEGFPVKTCIALALRRGVSPCNKSFDAKGVRFNVPANYGLIRNERRREKILNDDSAVL